MTEQEFTEKMLSVFPDATYELDGDGQIVIYTDMMYAKGTSADDVCNGDAMIVPFENTDEDYWNSIERF